MKLVLATQNPKKLKEMNEILSHLGVEVVSEAELGDIKKARLTFKSMVDSDPSNPRGWIAAARLEEQTGRGVESV